MPRDSSFLTVNNNRIDDVISYSADSDLYLAADAFEFTAKRTSGKILAGDRVRLWVNDKPAMTGVINKSTNKGTKRDGLRVDATGTDLMGMLCAHCSSIIGDIVAESGSSVSVDLRYLVRLMLSDIPQTYVNSLNDVIFQRGTSGLSISFEHISASPGQTVFDILRSAAASRGLLFWCDEEGKFNFGKPLSGGAPVFDIIRRSSGKGNNVIDGQETNDIEDGFSKVIVYSQSQSDGNFDSNNLSASAQLSVPGEFPFYRLKTVQINGDKNSPDLEARRLINQVKAKLYQYEYVVRGHSQNGLNYTTNVMAHIDDDDLDVHGDRLIYSRKFTMSKETGPLTILRLGLPGVVFNAS